MVVLGFPETVIVGVGFTLIITSSEVDVHGGFVMVHLNVTEEPTTSPVTPEVGEEVVVTVAVPAITVHNPVPGAGLFAARVVVV